MKSAGTESSARVKVTEGMVSWADYILVMEKRHRKRLFQKFPSARKKNIIVLDIEDIYEFMDEELVLSLKSSVEFLQV